MSRIYNSHKINTICLIRFRIKFIFVVFFRVFVKKKNPIVLQNIYLFLCQLIFCVTKYFRNVTYDRQEAAEVAEIKERITKVLNLASKKKNKKKDGDYICNLQREFDIWLNSFELSMGEYDTFLYLKEKKCSENKRIDRDRC